MPEELTESPKARLAELTVDDLFSYKTPDPITDDIDIEVVELSGAVRVIGFTKKAEREAVLADCRHHIEGFVTHKQRVTHPKTGESYFPDEEDCRAAAYAAKCARLKSG